MSATAAGGKARRRPAGPPQSCWSPSATAPASPPPPTSPPTPASPHHPAVRDLHPRRTRAPRRKPTVKRAMFLPAFACMNADPASRAHYDKQRARGKTHAQALLCLARQRISVLFGHAQRRHVVRTPHTQGRRTRRVTPASPNHPKPNLGASTKGIEAPARDLEFSRSSQHRLSASLG